jgi:two-component system phosphate regulon sensor histidine kinase PhoR
MNNSTSRMVTDSGNAKRHLTGANSNRLISLLYGVDSLQDSLRIKDITTAYSKKLAEEKIKIPYSIDRIEGEPEEPEFNSFTMGMTNPITYKLKAGNTFPYLIKKITLPILFSIILIGITILSFVLLYRNMLKQQRLAELKNEFISNITHELKTPIATVGVAIEALKNFNAINDQRRTKEYLDISSNELQRLGFLVDKVLKLSMFEKKAVDLKYEMINMRELVNEVVDSLRLQFEKHGAEVSVEQHGNLMVNADRLHLLSVVFNLLDNALKYSNEKPEIKISLDEKDNAVEMRVSDNGIGIPTAYREKVFEKFFRVPQGNVHNAKGYGLGLSYAAEVIRKHNGSIEVSENENNGTVFTIRIPKNVI